MTEKKYNIALWVSVIAAIAVVVGGMVWLASRGSSPSANPAINEVAPDDHAAGKADSPVRLVEYADFQCPACAVSFPLVRQLQKDYGDRVLFVFRTFLIPGHQNGPEAAYAAGAAGLQGKFWDMADELFAHQGEWAGEDPSAFAKTLDSYAQAIGLDMGKFRSDLASAAVKAKVDKDTQNGIQNGIDSTPSLFLNGKRIQPTSYDDFKSKIDAALRSAK